RIPLRSQNLYVFFATKQALSYVELRIDIQNQNLFIVCPSQKVCHIQGSSCLSDSALHIDETDYLHPSPCQSEITHYIFRRYSPPTSYSAWLICPRLCVFTASTRLSNTLRRSRAVACSSRSASSPIGFRLPWNPRTFSICCPFSSGVERISSISVATSLSLPLKVFTPTSGRLPSCFLCS